MYIDIGIADMCVQRHALTSTHTDLSIFPYVYRVRSAARSLKCANKTTYMLTRIFLMCAATQPRLRHELA